MTTIPRPAGWELRKGDILLGLLVYESTDATTDVCLFQPTRAFNRYQHLFDEWAHMLHNPGPEYANIDPYDYYEDAIVSLQLTLKPIGNVPEYSEYILHIMDAQQAWIQWLES